MKIVVKQPFTLDGIRYSQGTILDLSPKALMKSDRRRRVYAYILSPNAASAWEALRAYLDEKNVDYALGERVATGDTMYDTALRLYTFSNPNKVHTLILMSVPNKFYHKVVVPGIREVCKREGIVIKARDYISEDGLCSLELDLRPHSPGGQ